MTLVLAWVVTVGSLILLLWVLTRMLLRRRSAAALLGHDGLRRNQQRLQADAPGAAVHIGDAVVDRAGLGVAEVFEYALITEELARAWMSVASIIARGNGMGTQVNDPSRRADLLGREASRQAAGRRHVRRRRGRRVGARLRDADGLRRAAGAPPRARSCRKRGSNTTCASPLGGMR